MTATLSPPRRTPDINRILALPWYRGYSSWGADMGRRYEIKGEPQRLYLQRLRMSDYGCYDAGGAYWGSGAAYWGGPADLWCAFSKPFGERCHTDVMIFTRADSREEAKENFEEVLPGTGWTFRH
jgi:hypothetical protein